MISSSEIKGRSAGARANGTIRSVDKVIDILEVLSRESRGFLSGSRVVVDHRRKALRC